MAKQTLFLSLSASLQLALQSAQRLIWTQFRVWTLFVGMEQPLDVAENQRSVIVHLTTEEGEALEVFVFLVKDAKSWRVIHRYVISKGAWKMSNQRFNTLLIPYDPAEREKYGPKNDKFFARLNAGEEFAFKAVLHAIEYDVDEILDTYYAFIILRDGEICPLPIFCAAAEISMVEAFGTEKVRKGFEDGQPPTVGGISTSREIDTYLRTTFGAQYRGGVPHGTLSHWRGFFYLEVGRLNCGHVVETITGSIAAIRCFISSE